MKKIEVWGDSVLKGIIFDEEKMKYKKLIENIALKDLDKFGLDIKNNAHFGMTAPKASKLIQDKLKKGFDCEIVVIEFGGNDCDYKWAEISDNPHKEHKPNTPLDIFKICITNMVTTFRNLNIEPIMVNLPPLDAKKYFECVTKGLSKENILYWLGDVQHIYRHHECYNLCIMKLAHQLGCDLIDVREPFLKESNTTRFLCEDGIHPNEAGYELMNRTFLDSVGLRAWTNGDRLI
jgi:acyl-CoA thioesterase I